MVTNVKLFPSGLLKSWVADEKRSHRVQLERVPKFTKRSTLVVKRANRVSFLRVYHAKKAETQWDIPFVRMKELENELGHP